MTDERWVRHLKQNLPAEATREFTVLWSEIHHTALGTEPDSITWRWTANGKYSSKSAYGIQFEGSLRASFDKFNWKSDASGKCKVFRWLAILGRCNTADMLAKKGWSHDPAYALCVGPLEDALHLLATFPYTASFWQSVLQQFNMSLVLAPTPSTTSLLEWSGQTTGMVPAKERKAWSSLVQHIWWITWNERNARIFKNQRSTALALLEKVVEEAGLWHVASRRKANSLLNRPREPN
ncbi:uncharacterized protein [Aegilops tauschii subsp. strangulata]|uniref:uncharacterized protein n=1 Tax=Aegilops tauschii subsp. strangulata TaxID=200361 RepID=UPI003CC88D7F